MKITKRQLRRIIREEKALLEQSWRQNPAKIRLQRRLKDRDRMIDQMTFEQLKSRAFDSALFIQGKLDTGQYEYADIWEAEIPRLADTIDAAKVKAAEEGVTYDDIPEVIHNGGVVDLSEYSLGLPPGIKESKMKITKSELRKIIRETIIREEKAKLFEQGFHSMSPAGKALANSIKGKFMRMYPDAKVGIDGRGGFITVNGVKAIDMSQATGRGMSDDEMIEKMRAVYAEI